MSERARIAMRHKVGTVGRLLGSSTPPPSRDHRRENIRALRELERQLRHRRAQEERSTSRAAFKLREFENIPSRLHQTPQRLRPRPVSTADFCDAPGPSQEATPQRRPRSASVASANPASGSPWAKAPARGLTPPPVTRSPPRHGWGPVSAGFSPPPRGSSSFLEEEGHSTDPADCERSAERLHRRGPRRPPSDDGEGALLPSWWPLAAEAEEAEPEAPLGCHLVPEEERLQAAEAEDAEPAPPPGYRLMPEEERLQTLEDLKLKLVELDEKYTRLPLKIETEGARRQQQLLRAKIAETESAVKLFSRPRVLMEV